MKTMMFAAVSMIAAAPALAASPFDGTWKADLKSATYQSPPDVYTLAGGVYGCGSCKPAYRVPADGAFHKVAGHDYFDEVSITVVDPRTLKMVQRKGGKTVWEETDTVSADGRTVTEVSTDMSAAKPVSATVSETRIGAAPEGMHAINGHWNPQVASQVSSAGMTISLKLTGDMLSVVSPAGTSYVAKLGGPAVPVKGDIGGTMVKVKRLSATSFEATSTRGGGVTAIATITAHGNMMTYQTYSPLYGVRSSIKAYRQ